MFAKTLIDLIKINICLIDGGKGLYKLGSLEIKPNLWDHKILPGVNEKIEIGKNAMWNQIILHINMIIKVPSMLS